MNKTTNTCDLCGLPLRYGTVQADVWGKPHFFCCPGCRQVFRMLAETSDASNASGFKETELFRQCQQMGIIPASEADLQKASEKKISEPKKETVSSPENNGADEHQDWPVLRLKISGMWCPACAWVIDESLRKLPGVISPATNFSTDSFHCRYHPVETSSEALIRRIERLGYQAAPPGESEGNGRKRELIRFGISAVFAMNVMMLSFALYSGFFTELTSDAIWKLSWPICLLACIPFFYGGFQIHHRAWAGLSARSFSMELLISTAASTAFFYSVFNLLQGSIHLYFDTASTLITLTLLGKMIEQNAKVRVLKDLDIFFSLKPTKAKICTDAFPNGRYVSIDMLQKGDLFVVEADEIIPADGQVMAGRGLVDESSLTGEATPVSKKSGDRIKSGSRVIQGMFRVKAQAVGEKSVLGQMIRIIQKSLDQKTVFEGRTDRLLQAFVPFILLMAAGTGVVCYLLGLSAEDAMIRAITVMVISCPCALGIAIPLARVAGISLAGRKGLLIRDFVCFEKASAITHVVFDKTGTLTEGRFRLRRTVVNPPFDETQILAIAAALEEASDHYLSVEIRDAASRKGIAPVFVETVEPMENGVKGFWEGKTVRIGSRHFVSEETDKTIVADKNRAVDAEAENTIIYLSVDSALAGIFVFGDKIRNHARETVKRLNAGGISPAMISGDSQKTTETIGSSIGIKECRGEMLPADKADFVQQMQQNGEQVAMVGDGINDAPSLVAADISIAVFSGTHLGKEAAEITLMQSDPIQILTFFSLAKRVNRKIHQNLLCSFVYNILSIPIAMSGLLTPLVAVTAMLLSSLTVIGNTLLLLKREKAEL